MDPITLMFILGGGLLFAARRKPKKKTSLEPEGKPEPDPVEEKEEEEKPTPEEDELLEEKTWDTSENERMQAPVTGSVYRAVSGIYPYYVKFRHKMGTTTFYRTNREVVEALNDGYIVHPPTMMTCKDVYLSKFYNAWMCEGNVYPNDVVAYGIVDNGEGFTEYRVVLSHDKDVPFVGQIMINKQWHTKASYKHLDLAVANMRSFA